MTKLKEVGMKTPVVQIEEMNERDRRFGIENADKKAVSQGMPDRSL